MENKSQHFDRISKDFVHSVPIPQCCSCDGKDVTPHLSRTVPPPGTKSYALVCTDPDAPNGSFTHWIVYDIFSSITGLYTRR